MQQSAPMPLQWGRDHLIAEFSRSPLRTRATIFASMGPRSPDRGISSLAVIAAALGTLQWGRDHLIAELMGLCGCLSATQVASMGPRSPDRGIWATTAVVDVSAALQWG